MLENQCMIDNQQGMFNDTLRDYMFSPKNGYDIVQVTSDSYVSDNFVTKESVWFLSSARKNNQH